MKNVKSGISTAMFLVLVVGLPMFFISINPEDIPQTDPAVVEEMDRIIAQHQTMPISQMTGEPIGKFDENLRWVAFDRTRKP